MSIERAQKYHACHRCWLVDAGSLSQKMAKLDYVVNTAIMLAYVAASGDDKIGLRWISFAKAVRPYQHAGKKGKAQVYTIMNALYNVNAQMVESDYPAAFNELAARWRRRSLVLLFTDLIDLGEYRQSWVGRDTGSGMKLHRNSLSVTEVGIRNILWCWRANLPEFRRPPIEYGD